MIYVCYEKDIICPRLTCMFAFMINCGIFFWFYFFNITYAIVVGILSMIISIVILIFLWFTFPRKNYNLYKYAFFTTIIYVIIFTILRIVAIIVITNLDKDDFDDYDKDDVEVIKASNFILFPLGMFLDLLLLGIIFCYKKQVQKQLEPLTNELNLVPESPTAQENNMVNVG